MTDKSTQTSFCRGPVLVGTIPLIFVLLLANIFLWAYLKKNNDAVFRETHRAFVNALEDQIEQEVMQTRALSELPHVISVLTAASRYHARPLPEGITSETKLEQAWKTARRDEMVVREVLDNNVSESLRRTFVRQRWISNLMLVDAGSGLQAAAERTTEYFYDYEPWWEPVQNQAYGIPVVELLDGNTLRLAMAVWSTPQKGKFLGALVEDVNFDRLLKRINLNAMQNMGSITVHSNMIVVVAGFELPDQKGVADLIREFPWRIDKAGWKEGFRFFGESVNAGTAWRRPLWVVTVSTGGPFSYAVLGPLAAGLIFSLLVLWLWMRSTGHLLQRSFMLPCREQLEAGAWALKAVYGDRANIPIDACSAAFVEEAGTTMSIVQRDLDHWIETIRDQYAIQSTATQEYQIQHDLQLAKDFQQTYIGCSYPTIPEVHAEGRLRLEFYHRYQPAMALGGDFFDIAKLAPDCAGIIIADVMGHGIRSALITAILHTLIDDLAPVARDARHFLTEMNRLFCALLKNVPNPLFTSAFYFVADTTMRVGTYSSAGHPAPFLLRRSMDKIMRLEPVSPRGAALGLIPNETYTGALCRLMEDDLIVFFTDGAVDVCSTRGEEFGVVQMEKVLRDNMHLSCKEVVDNLMKAIFDFASGEPIADDICIVAVEAVTKPKVNG